MIHEVRILKPGKGGKLVKTKTVATDVLIENLYNNEHRLIVPKPEKKAPFKSRPKNVLSDGIGVLKKPLTSLPVVKKEVLNETSEGDITTDPVELFRRNTLRLVKQKGISISQLSVLAGVSRQTIYRVKSSKGCGPSLRAVVKIAKALDCDLSDLLKDSNVIQDQLGGNQE